MNILYVDGFFLSNISCCKCHRKKKISRICPTYKCVCVCIWRNVISLTCKKKYLKFPAHSATHFGWLNKWSAELEFSFSTWLKLLPLHRTKHFHTNFNCTICFFFFFFSFFFLFWWQSNTLVKCNRTYLFHVSFKINSFRMSNIFSVCVVKIICLWSLCNQKKKKKTQ